jgi:hypothetical protein
MCAGDEQVLATKMMGSQLNGGAGCRLPLRKALGLLLVKEVRVYLSAVVAGEQGSEAEQRFLGSKVDFPTSFPAIPILGWGDRKRDNEDEEGG